MEIKRHKPEWIITKFRQVEVFCCQRIPHVDAIRHVQSTVQAFYRRQKKNSGMGIDILKVLKLL